MSYQLWPEWSENVLPSLRNQMTRATFEAVLSESELYKNGSEAVILKAKSHLAYEWLNGRAGLSKLVRESLILAGLSNTITVQFTYEGGGLLDTPTGDTDAEPQPIWDTQELILWRWNHKESHTHYFRCYYRPLLGPLLSELVRELRQVAYKKNSKASEVEIDLTHDTLSESLGVSRCTISRNLKRKGSTGKFLLNDYLHLFIIESYTVKQFHEPSGRKSNHHTHFRIAMVDQILPEHENYLGAKCT